VLRNEKFPVPCNGGLLDTERNNNDRYTENAGSVLLFLVIQNSLRLIVQSNAGKI